jgi:hypothetical protein
MEIIDDKLGVKLHDRATTGGQLSAEEQEQLRSWYDAKDREEAEMLRANRKNLFTDGEIDERIRETLRVIQTLLKKTEETEAENELLRQEIAELRKGATAQPVSKAA